MSDELLHLPSCRTPCGPRRRLASTGLSTTSRAATRSCPAARQRFQTVSSGAPVRGWSPSRLPRQRPRLRRPLAALCASRPPWRRPFAWPRVSRRRRAAGLPRHGRARGHDAGASARLASLGAGSLIATAAARDRAAPVDRRARRARRRARRAPAARRPGPSRAWIAARDHERACGVAPSIVQPPPKAGTSTTWMPSPADHARPAPSGENVGVGELPADRVAVAVARARALERAGTRCPGTRSGTCRREYTVSVDVVRARLERELALVARDVAAAHARLPSAMSLNHVWTMPGSAVGDRVEDDVEVRHVRRVAISVVSSSTHAGKRQPECFPRPGSSQAVWRSARE